MELEESQVRALQALARGPNGSDRSLAPLERAGRELQAIFPFAELCFVELSPRARTLDLDLGQPLPQACCVRPEKGRHYLLSDPTAEQALALRLKSGSGPLSGGQRELLRVASMWLPRWIGGTVDVDEDLPPVGTGVWVDAKGVLTFVDDVGRSLLGDSGDLTTVFAALYRERRVCSPAEVPERTLEVGGHCLRLRAEYLREGEARCLVAIERLEPGTTAMFQARARGLNVREQQISELVLEGWGNRGIAHKLGLKSATINSYLIGVYRKLGVRNRTELTRYLSGASRVPLPASNPPEGEGADANDESVAEADEQGGDADSEADAESDEEPAA